jgi:putative DNA primase/helicase
LANIYADLKNEELEDTGPFKTLVAGDTVPAQRKYQQRFFFRNHATLVFSANDIPQTNDQSLAYFDRWIIFVFETIFLANEVITPNKRLARYRKLKRDSKLTERLTTQQELSGLFNLALIGLRKLIEDDGFIHCPTVDEVELEYRINSSTVQRFLKERCKVEPSNNFYWTVCDTLFTKYLDYCEETKLDPVGSEEAFGIQIAQAHLRRKQRRVGDDRPWCYFGVELKEGDLDH